MQNLTRWIAAAWSALFALNVNAQAAAPEIERAKASCVVGERNDGYLGFVPGARADDELRRLVAEINMKRKAAYAELATSNGASIEDTAIIVAETLINRAQTGECVQDASGQWIKVP